MTGAAAHRPTAPEPPFSRLYVAVADYKSVGMATTCLSARRAEGMLRGLGMSEEAGIVLGRDNRPLAGTAAGRGCVFHNQNTS